MAGREVPATRLQPPHAPAAVCSPHCRDKERAALPTYSLMPSGKGAPPWKTLGGFPQLEKEAVHTDPGSSKLSGASFSLPGISWNGTGGRVALCPTGWAVSHVSTMFSLCLSS